MRILLFYISVFLFMVGLFTLIAIGNSPSPWQIGLVGVFTISGVGMAAFLSCVSPPPKLEEMVPLTTREIDPGAVL